MSDTPTIRRAQEGDIPDMHELIHTTLDRVNAKHLEPDVIAGWKELYTEEKLKEKVANWFFVVAELDGTLCGTGACEGNELHAVFVHAGCHRRGVGTAIMNELESHIAKDHDSVGIHGASAAGLPFYEALGYDKDEQYVNSFGMSVHAMHKQLR